MGLREMRIEKGLSPEELAVELGVTRYTIDRWEAGKPIPKQSKLAIAYVFGLPKEKIFSLKN